MTELREQLQSIRTFPSLVRFLRDELDWPVETEDFEELTFDYSAEELGIDAANAAKIEEIKKLRPLQANQPWGIFFVKFEPKRLPVVALRRILAGLVVKKRATASAAEQPKWAEDDLLFISNYGEGAQRQITFAHFSQAETKHDLPTLKVLGWDNLDAPLHLDDVAEHLTHNLAWPEDDNNIEAWRAKWSAAFTLGHREVITTSRELSIRLAELARAIRDRITTALAIETEDGPLTKLMTAFQVALVHDLDADGFADMYAQTIAYGLLSARIADPHTRTADNFAGHMRTNPFLRELMETFLKIGGRRSEAGSQGIDFDELGVSDVIRLLDHANMEAVVRDFGDRNPEEDPVIHFYELFLKEYDPKKRMQRGVFYTPRPVVSYIVRSVDELLRTEFGLEDGLADTTTWGEMAEQLTSLKIPDGVSASASFVQILDPATGTGTFLVEAIDLIRKTLVAKWKAHGKGEEEIEGLWNEYVPEHLLPRLHGYELLMAPYAIAHLKIGLKLYETGYRFESVERARVYLTNALEPASDVGQQALEGMFPALAHEAKAVNAIKRDQRFTVVIGNPPYAIGSDNKSPWILDLLDSYKEGLKERKLNLDDDYIKYIRLGEHLISNETKCGVLGMISNASYLDGLVHRRMRRNLVKSFPRLEVLDLHGSSIRKEESPSGGRDENVFEIQQGVAIAVACAGAEPRDSRVLHGELWGAREEKYDALLHAEAESLTQTALNPSDPYWFLEPRDIDAEVEAEYERWMRVADIFQVRDTGIQTKRDRLTIHFTEEECWGAVQTAASCTPEELKTHFGLQADGRDWQAAWAIQDLRDSGPDQSNVRPILYRPFDVRWTYYTGKTKGFIAYPRLATQKHLLHGSNVALLCTRQFAAHKHFVTYCTRHLTEMSSQPFASYVVHPLYLEEVALGTTSKGVNLDLEFLHALGAATTAEVTPDTAFEYIYGLLHSPGYRSRYGGLLKIDFPRIPIPVEASLLREVATYGRALLQLHLMTEDAENGQPHYEGSSDPSVERVGWSDSTVWLDAPATKTNQPSKPGTIGFRGVPEEVWSFHIGGYQVCHKWLKDRKGRTLSEDDIAHYQKIVAALSDTIRLMTEIDEVIEKHGGWPGAFALASESRPTTLNAETLTR